MLGLAVAADEKKFYKGFEIRNYQKILNKKRHRRMMFFFVILKSQLTNNQDVIVTVFGFAVIRIVIRWILGNLKAGGCVKQV